MSNPIKLLIIEDDKEISAFLKTSLNRYEFLVKTARTGQAGLNLIKNNNYQLIIIDLGLPDLTGDKVCQIIREHQKMMPILIISGDERMSSKTKLLNLEADDYLTKPFSLEELIARIEALLRRPPKIDPATVKISDIELNWQKQIVKRGDQELYLTRKEFLLLEYLIRHANSVISRTEIMEHIWNNNADIFSKTIETHIFSLRKKIDNNRIKPLINTVSGRGYKLTANKQTNEKQ